MKSTDKRSLSLIANLKAKPDKIEALRKTLLDMIEPTRNEVGCLEYILFENSAQPGDFYMREEFMDQQSFDYHRATPHFKTLHKILDEDGLLAEPSNLLHMHRVSS